MISKCDYPNILSIDNEKEVEYKLVRFFNICHENLSRIIARNHYIEYINNTLPDGKKLKNNAIIKKLSISILPDSICYIALLLNNNVYIPLEYIEFLKLKSVIVLDKYYELLKNVIEKPVKHRTIPHELHIKIKEIINKSLSGELASDFCFTEKWLHQQYLNKRELSNLKYIYTEKLNNLTLENSRLSKPEYDKIVLLVQNLIDVCN